MLSISDVPTDVFSTITSFLPVESVTRLCQVSKRISEYVRADKWLWLECLRRDVISEGIELPKHRQSVENTSANDVRSWVATAISLHRAYASGGPSARVNSFAVDEDLETTWVKIIRGRWCLAAMSNNSQSYIGIWRTLSNGPMELENKFYFPGPVLDGAVDDGVAEIRIAITVATTDPYIQILSLGMKDETCLIPLEHLEGARHVLLLKDSIIGYATQNGDDTYPLITDWRIGSTVRLCSALYSNRPHMLFGDIHSVCHAMGIWRNHIIAVLDCSVEIFTLPSLGSLLPKPADHFGCQSLYFPMMQVDSDGGRVGEAFLKELELFPLEIMLNDTESSLRISIRNRSQRHYVLTLVQSPGDLGFSWEVSTLGKDSLSSRTLKLCVGTSNEYQLRLTCAYGIQYPAILELVRLTRLPTMEIDTRGDMKQTFVLSTPGLPNLGLTTVMDFDDAAGLLLLGSCHGGICIVQIAHTTSQARGGLLDDLPPVLHNQASLLRSSMPMNLPYCYYRPDMIYETTVPSMVLEEALRSWEKACALPKVAPPPGWSSDWRRNTKVQNWVLPFPRWRTLAVDQDFHQDHTWNRDLRATIGSRGDIVPIMYCETEHDFVIFKIAQRIYRFNDLSYENDDPRIWTLPFTEQDLSNPAVMAEVYRNRRLYGGPLCNRGYDVASTTLLKINEEYLRLLDFLKTVDGRMELTKRSLADDPRTWSLDDRTTIQSLVDWIWRGVYRPWGSVDDYYNTD